MENNSENKDNNQIIPNLDKININENINKNITFEDDDFYGQQTVGLVDSFLDNNETTNIPDDIDPFDYALSFYTKVSKKEKDNDNKIKTEKENTNKSNEQINNQEKNKNKQPKKKKNNKPSLNLKNKGNNKKISKSNNYDNYNDYDDYDEYYENCY